MERIFETLRICLLLKSQAAIAEPYAGSLCVKGKQQ